MKEKLTCSSIYTKKEKKMCRERNEAFSIISFEMQQESLKLKYLNEFALLLKDLSFHTIYFRKKFFVRKLFIFAHLELFSGSFHFEFLFSYSQEVTDLNRNPSDFCKNVQICGI